MFSECLSYHCPCYNLLMIKKFKKRITEFSAFSKSSHDSEKLLLEIFIGISALIGSLYIFLKLTHKVIDKEIIFFDNIIMQTIYDFHTPFLTQLMKSITFLGGEMFLGLAIILTIIMLLRKHKKDAFVFGFILLFGIILNLWLKGLLQRPRPDFFALVTETTFSFPSGHAMNSSVFFLSLTYFIFRNTRNKMLGIWLSILSAILVFLIGTSRIYLGVHYPSDVIAGFAAGLLWFVIILLFEKMLIFLRLFREYELISKY